MTFFSPTEPIFCRKQPNLAHQDQVGLWRVEYRIGSLTLVDRSYTRIDQVFMVWGLLTLLIFGTGQFLPFDWALQAIAGTGLAVVGLAVMTALSWFWVVVEGVSWLVGCWAALVGLGLLLTHLSISNAWGDLLLHLGPLWLVVSALGYVCTGLTLRSRALVLAALVHVLAAIFFFWYSDWQFLGTGLIHAGSLLFFGEWQWDMGLPTKPRFLL